MTTFLVERYWPGIDATTLRGLLPRLEALARAMTADGTPVEEALVRDLNARAALPVDRIAEAIALMASTAIDPSGGSRS